MAYGLENVKALRALAARGVEVALDLGGPGQPVQSSSGQVMAAHLTPYRQAFRERGRGQLGLLPSKMQFSPVAKDVADYKLVSDCPGYVQALPEIGFGLGIVV